MSKYVAAAAAAASSAANNSSAASASSGGTNNSSNNNMNNNNANATLARVASSSNVAMENATNPMSSTSAMLSQMRVATPPSITSQMSMAEINMGDSILGNHTGSNHVMDSLSSVLLVEKQSELQALQIKMEKEAEQYVVLQHVFIFVVAIGCFAKLTKIILMQSGIEWKQREASEK